MASTRSKPRYESASVFNPDGLPVWADRHRLDGEVAAHEHDFFEIALVTQGRALHIAADGDYTIQPGSAVVVPPNQWHAYGQCEDLVVFDCFVAPELIDSTLSFLDAELPLMQTLHTSSLPLPQRIQLGPRDLSLAIAELYSMSDVSPARRSRIQVVGHLLIYLDILNRAWAADRETHKLVPLHPAVTGAVQLMEEDPGRSWSLADLASATCTERTHLVRLFQRELGVPPIAYLNRLRAQAAARLLVQTDEPIAQIGARLGWEDASYFAQRFKNAYGLSPSAYRKRAVSGESRYHLAEAHLPVSGARFDTRTGN
ncbi:AraC family transcriptional regulator [Arthrobacter sp. M4]|uniref:helix-turn-helix transcriptional regulator n=1 Tax=Arthrobacter sp. M4 TaxID=218160 RepID=UPI001CDBFE94|nr:AraC family transcriptional regulator [Arthrobacter sp. M4]MCA4132599.1 AraC family transcriptional regulator [Arthrobacter sp. M4]